MAYFPLVPDEVAAYPSATAVVDGGYAYLFALDEKDARPMLLTRIPLAGLDTPARNLQYLANAGKKMGTWEPGFKPKEAMPVMDRGTSEMSVRYHPDLKQWLAVMRSPDLSSDAILLRTAPAITGPWSAGEVIFHIPEMQKDSPGYDKNVFCYAGKEHPEFEKPGSLVITYVCNTMKVPDLVTNSNIYVPKVVEVPLPADVISPAGDRRSDVSPQPKQGEAGLLLPLPPAIGAGLALVGNRQAQGHGLMGGDGEF